MDIHMMKEGHPLWERVITFAEKCSWPAGEQLARRMRNNGFADWERVFAATIDDNIVGFAVFSEDGGMPKEYDCKPFIGFVFVDEGHRGKRISERLISQIKGYAKTLGYQTLYLKSEHRGLYEKYGFIKIGNFTPIHGPADQLFKINV